MKLLGAVSFTYFNSEKLKIAMKSTFWELILVVALLFIVMVVFAYTGWKQFGIYDGNCVPSEAISIKPNPNGTTNEGSYSPSLEFSYCGIE